MNIYVGNLSYQVTEEDLRLAFEPFGQVESATIIKDKHKGKEIRWATREKEIKANAKNRKKASKH
jgi:RNA recognition motif-containing protein